MNFQYLDEEDYMDQYYDEYGGYPDEYDNYPGYYEDEYTRITVSELLDRCVRYMIWHRDHISCLFTKIYKEWFWKDFQIELVYCDIFRFHLMIIYFMMITHIRIDRDLVYFL